MQVKVRVRARSACSACKAWKHEREKVPKRKRKRKSALAEESPPGSKCCWEISRRKEQGRDAQANRIRWISFLPKMLPSQQSSRAKRRGQPARLSPAHARPERRLPRRDEAIRHEWDDSHLERKKCTMHIRKACTGMLHGNGDDVQCTPKNRWRSEGERVMCAACTQERGSPPPGLSFHSSCSSHGFGEKLDRQKEIRILFLKQQAQNWEDAKTQKRSCPVHR